MTIQNKVQLITYPDSLGGNLKTLNHLLLSQFAGIFQGGVHILPPFPSSGDRGFAPITYQGVEPKFGVWEDIQRISENHDVMLDLMVNHISRRSVYFQDFVAKGRKSQYADLFITLDKVWPEGNPPPDDVAKIFLRKPQHPFLDIPIEETGEIERIWSTFGSRADYSERVDLDVNAEITRRFFVETMDFLSQYSVKMLRLDAVGYVIKKADTSCFMVEPEVYEFISWLNGIAEKAGLVLLPEVHDQYQTQSKLAERGYWVYDFVLPMLVLHTLLNQNGAKLRDYLSICPRKQITTLDSHDGIPVQPDMKGILTVEESRRVVDTCLQRGANLNRILSVGKVEGGFDAHQINTTYYSALNCDDDAYLLARAIQFFAPGVPQVYYVGLLAGENDHEGVKRSGEGRAINRHNYKVGEVEEGMHKEAVKRLLKLIEFRNNHPAFNGDFEVTSSREMELTLSWQDGPQTCRLIADLQNFQAVILYTDEQGKQQRYEV